MHKHATKTLEVELRRRNSQRLAYLVYTLIRKRTLAYQPYKELTKVNVVVFIEFHM